MKVISLFRSSTLLAFSLLAVPCFGEENGNSREPIAEWQSGSMLAVADAIDNLNLAKEQITSANVSAAVNALAKKEDQHLLVTKTVREGEPLSAGYRPWIVCNSKPDCAALVTRYSGEMTVPDFKGDAPASERTHVRLNNFFDRFLENGFFDCTTDVEERLGPTYPDFNRDRYFCHQGGASAVRVRFGHKVAEEYEDVRRVFMVDLLRARQSE